MKVVRSRAAVIAAFALSLVALSGCAQTKTDLALAGFADHGTAFYASAEGDPVTKDFDSVNSDVVAYDFGSTAFIAVRSTDGGDATCTILRASTGEQLQKRSASNGKPALCRVTVPR